MGDQYDVIGGNPAPGSPDAIRQIANEIDQAADLAHQARIALSGIGSDLASSGWEGASAQKFASAYAPIPDDLGLMATSYAQVSTALSTYASHLEQVQAAVRHALTRAQLAAQQEHVARQTRDAAQQRISSLNRQLAVVRLDEARKVVELDAARLVHDPGHIAGAQHALDQTRANKNTVQGALYRSEQDRNVAQQQMYDADTDLRGARNWAEDLRADRKSAEHQAATSLEDALAHSLRNKSLFEQIGGWVDHTFHGVLNDLEEIGSKIIHHDWKGLGDVLLDHFLNIVETIRTIVSKLQFVLGIIMIIVIVASFFFAVTIGPALLLVAVVLAGIKLATSLILASTPDSTGRRRAGLKDVLIDGVEFSLSFAGYKFSAGESGKFAGGLLRHTKMAGYHYLFNPKLFVQDPDSEFGVVKRVLYDNGREAKGLWRTVHIHEGSQIKADVKAISELNDIRKYVADPGDPVYQISHQKFKEGLKEFQQGVAVPIVGRSFVSPEAKAEPEWELVGQ